MQRQSAQSAKIIGASIRFIGRDIPLTLIGMLLLFLLIVTAEPAVWFLQPVQLLLGMVYIFFVPGYYLSVVLFPKKDDLEGVERIGLSVWLSIALITVLALLLDKLALGLTQWSIVLSNFIAVVLLAAAAIWRRAQLPVDEPAYVPDMRWHDRWRTLEPFVRSVYMIVAVVFLMVLAAMWLLNAYSPGAHVTEFYMLGRDEMAENYPHDPAVNEELEVMLGIANQERQTQTYRVEVWVTWAWDPEAWNTLVQEAGPFTLEPGERLEQPITWRMPWEAEDAQVYFQLFREDEREPYRELLLWMNVTDEAGGRS